jgi:uncharacterized protein YcbX
VHLVDHGAAGIREAERLEQAEQAVGTVETLWRYPVKSMLGERRSSLLITEHGSVGDRAWALREVATGRIASAKKFPRLLDFHARYESEPTSGRRGSVIITAPDGSELEADDPATSERISDVLGHELRLDTDPRRAEKTTIDRASVFGDVPVHEMKPDWTKETMPDHFALMQGSFFEIGPIYLLTSGSVEHLRSLQGGTALIDQRRFRPNIYIDSVRAWDGFVEDAWLGRALTIGDSFVCADFQPTLWCVTSTLAQQELPRDLSILRTTANHHAGCLGVYGSVTRPGIVRVGDPVVLTP